MTKTSTVNLLDAFKLANRITDIVGGMDLAITATAFAIVLGRAAQPLSSVQQIALQNHVCKYMTDFGTSQ